MFDTATNQGSQTGRAGRQLAILPMDGSAAPPECLQRCLGGQPGNLTQRGCAWLRAALGGRIEPALLNTGQCDQGLLADASECQLHGQRFLAIELQSGKSELSVASLPLRQDQAVHDRLSQLTTENEALVDEVLRSYEKLNLMFNLTRQISTVTHVGEIEALLMQRVAQLFGVERVRMLDSEDRLRIFVGKNKTTRPANADEQLQGLADMAARVRSSGGVVVESLGTLRCLAGPLARLDDRVEVIAVSRNADDPDFTSGDVQLLEALLTFGGQILTNNELHQRLRQMSIEATRALVSAIDKKDHYTFGHSERVGFLARLTGVKLGLTGTDLELLEWAGLLHDVGKIGVPEEILSKPGKLTDDEFEKVKEHPVMGYEILKPISDFEPILLGVLYHHENPDGSGYPHALKSDEIPLFAGILHVVDVFDALTSARSYRPAFSSRKALDIINSESGTKLDARYVEAFLAALDDFRTSEPATFYQMFPAAREEEEPGDEG